MRLHRWSPLVGLFLLGAIALPALAQGRLQAGPTLIEFSPNAASARLRLRNTGDAPVAAQVRVYAWSQAGGEDVLQPSDDLAVSPPIAEVPAGGEQLVRLVNLAPAAAERDRTYRVVVDELPRPEERETSQVTLRLRYVIPAFARAADATDPALTCTLEANGARLACDNHGGRPAQLGQSRLLPGHGPAVVLNEGLFGYVLPGSRRVWPIAPALPDDVSRAELRLETQLNGRSTTLPVGLAP